MTQPNGCISGVGLLLRFGCFPLVFVSMILLSYWRGNSLHYIRRLFYGFGFPNGME
jgi:hypothetical protein